jgi:thioesterase domain-containing protein
MIECYISAVRKAYPGEPYYMGGYSFGGIVAFEMGKKLVQCSKRVAWVGIMDVPSESLIPADYNWVDGLTDLCHILKLTPTRSPDELKRSLEQAFPETVTASTTFEPPSAGEIMQWVFDNCNQEQWKTLQLTRAGLR